MRFWKSHEQGFRNDVESILRLRSVYRRLLPTKGRRKNKKRFTKGDRQRHTHETYTRNLSAASRRMTAAGSCGESEQVIIRANVEMQGIDFYE
jgi:hypothetical protein